MKLEVIIIDDDEIMIMIQKKMIINSSFNDKPLSFLNGKLGLDYIEKDNDADKLYFIFLDINMPVMNGWEFLDALNKTSFAGNVIVAVLSSSTNESDKQKVLQYTQVTSYLEKPINTQKLNELKQSSQLKYFFKQ
jgi:CheY-like chemotaxis protein